MFYKNEFSGEILQKFCPISPLNYGVFFKVYKRPSSEDESVYTAHGTASFGEFFSPPDEAIVPTERTNSVVSTCAFIFGKCSKVECVFTIVAVSILLLADFESNDHREDAFTL